MAELFARHPANPIVVADGPDWRRCVTFNPGVERFGGRWVMLERAAGGLRPFVCHLGLLESQDGVSWTRVGEQPALSPADLGYPLGSLQDARLVVLEGRLLATYAFRKFAWHSHPTGVGVPESHQPTDVPEFDGDPAKNTTRSGIGVSEDGRSWRHLAWVTPEAWDDRDVILFPERIGGRYAVLRRPLHLGSAPAIWLSWSDDLATWSEPELIAEPRYAWENNRIGASAPPIRTPDGWLVLYHGVETTDPEVRAVTYHTSALLLDLDDPTKVLARGPTPILSPREYYERFGLYIPNVIFPTANVLVGDELWVYAGVCDTAIALYTAKLEQVLGALEPV